MCSSLRFLLLGRVLGVLRMGPKLDEKAVESRYCAISWRSCNARSPARDLRVRRSGGGGTALVCGGWSLRRAGC